MSTIRSTTAKLLDRAVHLMGGRARASARKFTPLWLKRHVSAFLSSNVELEEETVLAATGNRFVALKEPVFSQVRYDGIYEKELSRIIAEFVSEGDVVADVGANFGWHSISMAGRVGQNGKVFSFEPNSQMFDALTKNIELNNFGSRIVPLNVAVGEQSGTGKLNSEDGQSAIGYMSLDEGPDSSSSISIVSLDSALEAHVDQTAFIKIDVEGFEPYVLRGASKILSGENPPVMMVEFSPIALERQPVAIGDFLRQLHALDFDMTLPVDGQLTKVDAPPHTVVTNLFMLPKKGRYQVSQADINSALRG